MNANSNDNLDREKSHWRLISENEVLSKPWSSPAGLIRKERRVSFLTEIPLDVNSKVLEVGAGSGIFTVEISKKWNDLTSIDLSLELLETAKERNPRVNFKAMDAHELQFDDNSFDAIVGVSILHHLDWTRALNGFYKKLKSGGWIRFSEPNLLNPQIFLQKNIPFLKKMAGDSPDEYAFTVSQITQSLRKTGFSDIKVVPFEFMHPSTPNSLVPAVLKLESFISKSFLKHIGGSLLISARKA